MCCINLLNDKEYIKKILVDFWKWLGFDALQSLKIDYTDSDDFDVYDFVRIVQQNII